MKLTVETYKRGIKILSSQYLDWKFDLTNDDTVQGWYGTLSYLISEENFIDAVVTYCRTKAKGPNSAVALYEAYIENFPQETPLEALNTLRGILKLFELDEDDSRVVEALTSTAANNALYITYCSLVTFGETSHSYYPNAQLDKKLEDSYTCNLFIAEYKRNTKKVFEAACRESIIAAALPGNTKIYSIGGN